MRDMPHRFSKVHFFLLSLYMPPTGFLFTESYFTWTPHPIGFSWVTAEGQRTFAVVISWCKFLACTLSWCKRPACNTIRIASRYTCPCLHQLCSSRSFCIRTLRRYTYKFIRRKRNVHFHNWLNKLPIIFQVFVRIQKKSFIPWKTHHYKW